MQKAGLCQTTEAILGMIKHENRNSKKSLYRISKKYMFPESYNFLLFYLENKKKLPKQYNQFKENLSKTPDLYAALDHRKTKIMLKLVQFLDLAQADNSCAPIPVNYGADLYKNIFGIIRERGSYEQFETQLWPIIEHVASSLMSNAEPYMLSQKRQTMDGA